jgi:hypothetical protein
MFRCKREYCNFSQICPFYHSEEEKKTWDKTFSNYIRKDRISYVKDKVKYFENKNQQGGNNANKENGGNGGSLNSLKSEKNNSSSKSGSKKEQGKRGKEKFTFEEKQGKSKQFQGKKWDDWRKESVSQSPKSTASRDSRDSMSLPSSMKDL